MFERFVPKTYVKEIYTIDAAYLNSRGMEAMLLDLDNTLTSWNQKLPSEQIKEYISSLKTKGIKIAILSNNSDERVRIFSDDLNVPYVANAKKPFQSGFEKALKKLNVSKEKTVMIGDQLLTDVFGGNLYGLHTILVYPVAKSDEIKTKLNRVIERFIINRLRKKGIAFRKDEWIDQSKSV